MGLFSWRRVELLFIHRMRNFLAAHGNSHLRHCYAARQKRRRDICPTDALSTFPRNGNGSEPLRLTFGKLLDLLQSAVISISFLNVKQIVLNKKSGDIRSFGRGKKYFRLVKQ